MEGSSLHLISEKSCASNSVGQKEKVSRWLLEVKCPDRYARQEGSDQRANYWNSRVAPVRIPLSGDRQDRVSDARAEVAGRIDGISCCAAERKTDRPHEASDEVWAESCCDSVHSFGKDRADDENQDEGADDFADQVGCRAPNGRRGTKHCQLQRGISGFFPMRKKMQPYEGGSHNRSQHLSRDVRPELGVIARGNGESQGDSGVQKGVLAPAGGLSEHPPHSRKAPPHPTHHP